MKILSFFAEQDFLFFSLKKSVLLTKFYRTRKSDQSMTAMGFRHSKKEMIKVVIKILSLSFTFRRISVITGALPWTISLIYLPLLWAEFVAFLLYKFTCQVETVADVMWCNVISCESLFRAHGSWILNKLAFFQQHFSC